MYVIRNCTLCCFSEVRRGAGPNQNRPCWSRRTEEIRSQAADCGAVHTWTEEVLDTWQRSGKEAGEPSCWFWTLKEAPTLMNTCVQSSVMFHHSLFVLTVIINYTNLTALDDKICVLNIKYSPVALKCDSWGLRRGSGEDGTNIPAFPVLCYVFLTKWFNIFQMLCVSLHALNSYICFNWKLLWILFILLKVQWDMKLKFVVCREVSNVWQNQKCSEVNS